MCIVTHLFSSYVIYPRSSNPVMLCTELNVKGNSDIFCSEFLYRRILYGIRICGPVKNFRYAALYMVTHPLATGNMRTASSDKKQNSSLKWLPLYTTETESTYV